MHVCLYCKPLCRHSVVPTVPTLCPPNPFPFQVIDFPQAVTTDDPPLICYDPEWLAITRAYHGSLPLTRAPADYRCEAHDDHSIKKKPERKYMCVCVCVCVYTCNILHFAFCVLRFAFFWGFGGFFAEKVVVSG